MTPEKSNPPQEHDLPGVRLFHLFAATQGRDAVQW